MSLESRWYFTKKKIIGMVIATAVLLGIFYAAVIDRSSNVFQEKDGEYTIEASLEGGTGKVYITSPMVLTIKDHEGTARVEWSSSNYDYMIVSGEKLYPVNTEGNSVFEVPVGLLDQPMTVTADTIAMSVPHEIEYTLTFHSETIKRQDEDGSVTDVQKADADQQMDEEEGKSQIEINNLEERKTDISPQMTYLNSMDLSYAECFAVDYYEGGYCLLTLSDGSRFLTVPENMAVPDGLYEDVTLLQQPISGIYLVASAAMDMFCELDALDSIRFSGQKAAGWYIDEAKAAMEDGKMLYAGKYSMPDYELIVSGGCKLAIENTMITHSPEVIEKLQEFDIPVMIEYSSYETHPLGRAEWIRFYGALLGKEEQAEELFRKQEAVLQRVSQEEQTGQTVAFFYITSNGTVNVRQSSDYLPQMIELAGGKYIFDNQDSGSGKKSSVNMSMEEFYAAAKEADYLLYNSTIDGEIRTVEELLKKSSILQDFKAVKNGNVWCTTNDLYQHPLSAGDFTEDIRKMLSGDYDDMKYIYQLEQEGRDGTEK